MSFELLCCIILALFALQSILFLLLARDAAAQLRQLKEESDKPEPPDETADDDVPERIKRQFANLMNYDGTAAKQVSIDDD